MAAGSKRRKSYGAGGLPRWKWQGRARMRWKSWQRDTAYGSQNFSATGLPNTRNELCSVGNCTRPCFQSTGKCWEHRTLDHNQLVAREKAAKEQARLQAERKRAEEKRVAEERAAEEKRVAEERAAKVEAQLQAFDDNLQAFIDSPLSDWVNYDSDTFEDDYPFDFDIIFASRRCGTCYEAHYAHKAKPEWCPYCITELPDPIFDGWRDEGIAAPIESVATFINNFSKEARRAQRWRMARRRGFRTVNLHGPPLPAAMAYGNRFGTAWVAGLPMYEDHVRRGHGGAMR